MDSRNNNEGAAFANNTGNHEMFANSQQPQFNAYDNLYLSQNNGPTPNFNHDAGWGVNASDFPNQNAASRGQHPMPSWQQQNNANHLSASPAHAGYNGQASPYGRPLNQSPVPYGQNNFNNVNQQHQYQYRQPHIDATQAGNRQPFNNVPLRSFNSPAQNGSTVTPQSLDRQGQTPNFPNSPYGNHPYPQQYARPTQVAPYARTMVDPKAIAASIPKGADAGMFNVLNFDNLAQATNSNRVGSFVNIGKEAMEWDSTRSAVPVHFARKSRNDLRALAANNSAALAKLGKKFNKTKIISVPGASGSASSPQIKYESTSTEDSSSDDSDSDDSDDDDESPLPTKRPDNPKEGVEYDTIKALWRSKRKHLSGESIRKGLLDFWELVRVIRDRWKADAAAVAEAEEKKRAGELPLLQSRVKDQRDMTEAAFKAAHKYGHRAIVELLAENVSLVFLCYQYLLDRYKADDMDCSLTRAMLETMSMFATLDKEKLEKTHLVKVLPRYQKKGDAKTKFWANKIVANAEVATKEAAAKSDQKKPENRTAAASDQKASAPVKKPGSDSVAGVKRAATSALNEATAAKKAALAKPSSTGSATSKLNGVVKKPVSSADSGKTSTTATAVKKSVVVKPSGFFSSLQSASKKPGTSIADKGNVSVSKPSTVRSTGATAAPKPAFSFAETMANLVKPKEEKPAPVKVEKEIPNETPEARAKRLRKEQRRKLHVQFKPLDELVEVRYFTHDPEEEVDQGSSQKRDFSDVGGEGRMLKQSAHMMDIDDEDEVAEEAENLRDHKPPTRIDFSVLPEDERKRNYEPYGGELKVESKERAAREHYENNNLIVFYTDPNSIPPNPKEPSDPYNGEKGEDLKYFGAVEEKYVARARAKRAQQQPYGHQMQQHQAGAPAAPDIQSILASLAQAAPNPAQFPQVQASAPMAQPYMGMPAPQAPQAPPANIDLAAILASLNPGGTNQQGTAYGAPPMNFAPQYGGGNGNNNDKESKKNQPYKVKVCRFWQQGSCTRGDACTFLHE